MNHSLATVGFSDPFVQVRVDRKGGKRYMMNTEPTSQNYATSIGIVSVAGFILSSALFVWLCLH